MKPSGHQFSNYNLFYLRFLSCTILTLAILGVTVNLSIAVNNNDAVNNNNDAVNHTPDANPDATNYTAAVSTFTIFYFYFRPSDYSEHGHQLWTYQ